MADLRRARVRRTVRLLALLVVAALVSACSSLPTSGPVRAGRDLQPDREAGGVRVIGQPPVPGSRPQEIVRGFLQAGADFVEDHAVARQYLTPDAARKWKPDAGTAVYDRTAGTFSVEATEGGQVELSAAHVGGIDKEGHFTRTSAGTRLDRTFRMARYQGQWRIDGLDNGLVLTRSDVRETFQHLNLYFLSPSRRVLVPETVLLPAVAGLSTVLVDRLLQGPGRAVAPATTTAFPRDAALAVSSVPIRDGIARVNLDTTVRRADDEARELMSAQLVWTLKQLPDFQGLRLSVEGDDLVVPGQGQVQSRDAWSGYDPGGLPQNAVAYAVRGGQLGQVVDGRFTPAAGPAGVAGLNLGQPAVSLDGSRAAGLTDGGRVLRAGRLADPGSLDVVLRGAALASPSWDPGRNLWVVDAPVGRVWMIPEGRRDPVPVEVPTLAAGRVTAVRVARDGARVAVVAGVGAQSRLYVGSVAPGAAGRPSPRLVALTEVLPGLRDVRDVAWADAATLAVAGSQDRAAVAPVYVDTDGYQVALVEPLPGLAAIAAAPSPRPLIAGTDSGQVVQYTLGRGWVDLGPGLDPTYPG